MDFTDVPVGFIPSAYGGQPVNSSAHDFALAQVQRSGVQPIMVLWHQGETEALRAISAELYRAGLDGLVNHFYDQLQVPIMIAEIGPVRGAAQASVESIRQVIREVWAENSHVLQGPSLSDMHLAEGVHFTTDAEIAELAARWFERLVAVGLPPADFEGGVPDAARYVDAAPALEIILRKGETPILAQMPLAWQTDALTDQLRQTNGEFIALPLPQIEQFWFVGILSDALRATLEADYLPYRSYSWGQPLYLQRIIIDYRRKPAIDQYVLDFGGVLRLQSWHLAVGSTADVCTELLIETWWLAQAIPQDDYSITLVLADVGGMGVAQADGPPDGRQTQGWRVGEARLDRRAVEIPCDLPSGEYSLLIGLYDPDTVQLLQPSFPDGSAASAPTYLTTITVRDSP